MIRKYVKTDTIRVSIDNISTIMEKLEEMGVDWVTWDFHLSELHIQKAIGDMEKFDFGDLIQFKDNNVRRNYNGEYSGYGLWDTCTKGLDKLINAKNVSDIHISNCNHHENSPRQISITTEDNPRETCDIEDAMLVFNKYGSFVKIVECSGYFPDKEMKKNGYVRVTDESVE